MPAPPPKRRPVNLAALEEHAATVKLRTGVVLPETRKKTVSLPRESFVPLIQAEVGADPSDVVGTLEQIEHVAFEVYAAPVQESDDYFRAVRRELQEALAEGVILIERQQVALLCPTAVAVLFVRRTLQRICRRCPQFHGTSRAQFGVSSHCPAWGKRRKQ